MSVFHASSAIVMNFSKEQGECTVGANSYLMQGASFSCCPGAVQVLPRCCPGAASFTAVALTLMDPQQHPCPQPLRML